MVDKNRPIQLPWTFQHQTNIGRLKEVKTKNKLFFLAHGVANVRTILPSSLRSSHHRERSIRLRNLTTEALLLRSRERLPSRGRCSERTHISSLSHADSSSTNEPLGQRTTNNQKEDKVQSRIESPLVASFVFVSLGINPHPTTMPVILAETNQASFPAGFPDGLSSLIATTLGKDKDRVWLRVNTGIKMYHGGAEAEPIVIIGVSGLAIPAEDEDQLNQWSGTMTDWLVKQTGLTAESIVIQWSTLSLHKIARGGKILGI
ncbi:unnamed protein product [Cyprideis torosa]|uniref:Uncharacterized protein n=1 Tax=Cyprideis torosa TaxID=163714 RepID=A0A7R8ZQ52_9CRUS|nr:unnamed protein product [Cyprideis torosa]CAG0902132.1 unnamed protein product [Cyprideis torosa]